MASVIKTSQILANELLFSFKNSAGLTRSIDHQFEKKFGKAGAKIGSSLDLRDPVQVTSEDGQAITPQSIEERIRTLRLNQHYTVSWAYDQEEGALSVDQWMERHGKPAIQKLANRWDLYLMQLAYQSTGHYVGTPNTAPTTGKIFSQARAFIQKYGGPPADDMIIVIDPDTQTEAVDLSKLFFNSQPQLKRQYEDGNMGRANGFNWHMSQNVRRHTVGALGGTPLVKGAAQTGSNLLTDGWTASTAVLKRGDSIRLLGTATATNGVYGVNPITKETLPDLENFVVTADVTSDASGNATIPISPQIEVAGAYQTVSNVPVDNAIIQIFAHATSYASKVSSENLAIHPKAITAAVFPLPVPSDVIMGETAYDEEHGIGVSFWRASDITSGKTITRVDFLGGAVVTHPEWICRILGA